MNERVLVGLGMVVLVVLFVIVMGPMWLDRRRRRRRAPRWNGPGYDLVDPTPPPKGFAPLPEPLVDWDRDTMKVALIDNRPGSPQSFLLEPTARLMLATSDAWMNRHTPVAYLCPPGLAELTLRAGAQWINEEVIAEAAWAQCDVEVRTWTEGWGDPLRDGVRMVTIDCADLVFDVAATDGWADRALIFCDGVAVAAVRWEPVQLQRDARTFTVFVPAAGLGSLLFEDEETPVG